MQDRDKNSIPILVELLECKDGGVQVIAAYALGQIGPDVQQAVPVLLKVIKEADRVWREYDTGSLDLSVAMDKGEVWAEAVNAVKKIDPDPAAKTGVK